MSNVHLPQHYGRWAIEPVTFCMKNGIGFAVGNVVKYITRHDAKNGSEDVKKAIRYAQMILEEEYGENLYIDWEDVTKQDQQGLPFDTNTCDFEHPWDQYPGVCRKCGKFEDELCPYA